MLRCGWIVVTVFVIPLLAACANTTALEPQNQPLDTRQARLYFIRPSAILSKLGSAEIRIDGKSIGSIATGRYIAADRPPGPHKITAYSIVNSTGSEANIQIEPGITYYFELGPIVETNADLFARDAAGITGRPLPGHHSMMSAFMFYSLDSAAGAAAIARLNAQR